MYTYPELLEARTEKQQLADEYCDYHKDVYGIKARWIYGQLDSLTVQDLKNMLDDLAKQYKIVAAYERERQKAADVAFVEEIKRIMQLGASDVATAIEWLHQSNNTDGSNDFLGFEYGCSYRFVDRVLKEGLDAVAK